MTEKGTPRRVTAGWDGNSNPITELWYPCGCMETDQRPRVIVKTCLTHLREFIDRDATDNDDNENYRPTGMG